MFKSVYWTKCYLSFDDLKMLSGQESFLQNWWSACNGEKYFLKVKNLCIYKSIDLATFWHLSQKLGKSLSDVS